MIGHFVLNDCMLAYPTCEMNVRFIRVVVMAVDVLKGGDPTLIDREVLADSNNLSDENKMRAATDADYERFKVKNPYQ